LAAATAAGVLGATLTAAPAHAAGAFTAEYGGGDPLHGLGDGFSVSTYVMADVDGDDDLDVVVREPLGDAGLVELRNDGGTFVATAAPFAGIGFTAHPANFVNTRVLVGDFDADGDVDLWHHGVEFAALYRNDGATFSAQTGSADPLAALAGRDPGTYVVADVDGDDDPDVVARDAATDASVDLFRNDHGTFVLASAPFAAVSFPANAANFVNTCILVLDADADGDLDLWHQGAGFAALYRNDGATFSAQTGGADPLAALGSYDAHSYVTMDVDSDADLDVVAREPVTDVAIDVLRNDGSAFTPLTGPASPIAAVSLAVPDVKSTYLLVGDHDGDGDTDLYNQALNELYRQAGSAPLAGVRVPARGAAGVAVTAGLTLSFSEPVSLGTGAVVLRDAATGVVLHRLDVDAQAARFTGAGTATIAIELPAPLPFATTVAVTVEPGALVATNDGDAFAGIAPTAWRFTTAANTAPAVGALNGDAATFTEGDAPVPVDAGAGATVVDADGIGFAGGELTATVVGGGSIGEDHLAVGLFDGGTTVTVPLGPADDAATVSGLLHALTYTNDGGDVPTGGTRTIEVALRDGDGLTATATVTVDVQAIDDAPAIGAPAQLHASVGAAVPVGAITVEDPDDATLDAHVAVDVGTLTGGIDELDLEGTPAVLSTALRALTWTAPGHAGAVSSGDALTIRVDDGTTAVTRSVALAVTAPPHDTERDGPADRPPSVLRPHPPRSVLPPPVPEPDRPPAPSLPTVPGAAPTAPRPGPVVATAPPAGRGPTAAPAPIIVARRAPTAPAAPSRGVPVPALLVLLAVAIALVVLARNRRSVRRRPAG
jgi:hypothetical protein